MHDFLARVSRRRFLLTASTTAIASTILKSYTSSSAIAQSIPATDRDLLAQAVTEDESVLYAAAKQEGKLVYYMSFHNQEILNAINAAFTKKYPGIQFEGTRKPAGPLFQQLNQEMQAGVKNCDVFSTGDIGQIMQLADRDRLMAYEPAGKENLRSQLRNFNAQNLYQPAAVLPVVIGYNTQKLSLQEAPKSWQQLIEPRYKDLISTGSAAASAQVGIWATVMAQKYGWEKYFSAFDRLNPKLGRSINDPVADVISGERALGIVPLGQILAAKAKGNPVDVIYPAEGAVVAIGAAGILKDTPRPNAAKLFLNFLMGQEYTQLVVKYFEQPLRNGIVATGSKPLDKMQPIILTPEQIRTEIPQIQKRWKEMFGV